MKIPQGLKMEKLPSFEEVLRIAEENGACEEGLSILRKHYDWMELFLASTREQVISWAFWYLWRVLKEPFPGIEPLLVLDPFLCMEYVLQFPSERKSAVLMSRALSTPHTAYRFAVVEKQRMPELESLIRESGVVSFLYARDVLHTRWPEAEERIRAVGPWGSYCRQLSVPREEW